MPMKSLLLFPALALSFAHAYAADSIPEHDHDHQRGWNTSAELGAISTSGNTVGTSVTGKLDAKQELPDWSNEYILAGYYKDEQVTQDDGEKRSERSAQRYSAVGQSRLQAAAGPRPAVRAGDARRTTSSAPTRATRPSASVTARRSANQDTGKSLDVEIGPGYFRGARSTNEDRKRPDGARRGQS
jgi:putative salt-induced outer membrane protein